MLSVAGGIIIKVIKVNKKWFLPLESTHLNKEDIDPISLPVPLPPPPPKKKDRVKCDHGDKTKTKYSGSSETPFVAGELGNTS